MTRSGAIASVHSFAQSSIGTYFVYFIFLTAAVAATLMFYRWPELRDLPPSRQLRKAAVISGWVGLIGGGPAAAYISNHTPMPIVAFGGANFDLFAEPTLFLQLADPALRRAPQLEVLQLSFI